MKVTKILSYFLVGYILIGLIYVSLWPMTHSDLWRIVLKKPVKYAVAVLIWPSFLIEDIFGTGGCGRCLED